MALTSCGLRQGANTIPVADGEDLAERSTGVVADEINIADRKLRAERSQKKQRKAEYYR